MTHAQFASVQWGLILTAVFLLPQLFFRQLTWRSALCTGYFSMLFAAVFLPLTGTHPGQAVQLVPFQWIADWARDGDIAFEQMALNILLFVPLGVIAKLMWQRGRQDALAIGFAISFAIECAQLAMGHRIFDVDDLITNTTGTLLGYGLAVALLHAHRVPDRLGLQVRAQA